MDKVEYDKLFSVKYLLQLAGEIFMSNHRIEDMRTVALLAIAAHLARIADALEKQVAFNLTDRPYS